MLLAFATACSGSDGAKGDTGPRVRRVPARKAAPAHRASARSCPASAFLGGSATVTISGNGTAWSDQAKPDFGKGVTVNSITVASPTALVADIDVAFDANLGARDVTVTDGSDSLTYKGSFRVQPPTTLDVQGTVAQGSIVLAKNPQSGFFPPVRHDASRRRLVHAHHLPEHHAQHRHRRRGAAVNGVQAYSVDAARAHRHGNVPEGAAKLDVSSSETDGRPHELLEPSRPRREGASTPEALVSGSARRNVAVDKPHRFAAARLAASGLRIVEIDAAANDTDAAPQVFLLGATGHFGNLIGDGANIGLATDKAPKLNVSLLGQHRNVGSTSTLPSPSSRRRRPRGEPNDTGWPRRPP